MPDDTNPFGDAEAIFSYSEDEAVADGVLVDVTEACKIGQGRWLITNGIHVAIEEKDDGRTYEQKMVPLVHDALMIVNDLIVSTQRKLRKMNITFAELRDNGGDLITKGLEGNVTGQDVWIGMNGSGGFTLMFPSER